VDSLARSVYKIWLNLANTICSHPLPVTIVYIQNLSADTFNLSLNIVLSYTMPWQNINDLTK